MSAVARLPRARGFTLVEVLVVLGMVGVLCTFTYPSYAAHMKKGRARTAALELLSLSLVMEGRLNQQRVYPPLAEGSEATPARFPGWQPVMGEHFRYTVHSTSEGYTLKAEGRAALRDCTITLRSNGSRSASAACGLAGWS